MKAPEKPIQKVSAAGAAGAASVIVVWLVGLTGLEVPPEVASAFSTLCAFGAGYLR